MANVLITGGAGFIGTNLTQHLVGKGNHVTVFDNLSRHGTDHNLRELRSRLGDKFLFIQGDVRNYEALAEAARGQDLIFHLAAQVAVTTSVSDPRTDFEINALGTFNTLEAARLNGKNPIVIYASTNKVYGGMDDEPLTQTAEGYQFGRLKRGVPESYPLDFHSPYGCSKGSGDQYVHDYARIYGLRTVVFRQSCIYGPHQFGIEDQGWLAHFVIQAAIGNPINIYGDGHQVRDVLYVDDLVRAFESAVEHIDKTSGQVYNIGGGPDYTLSVWTQVRPILEELVGHRVPVTFGDWRPGDQRIYVSDIQKAADEFGWRPVVPPAEGIKRLWEWVKTSQALIETVRSES